MELTLLKFARTWSPMPLSREFGNALYRAAALAYCLPFDLLVLWGLMRGRLAPLAKLFLLLPAIYFTGVHMLSVGSLRYRVPVEPPMAVIAASLLCVCRKLDAGQEASPVARSPMPPREVDV